MLNFSFTLIALIMLKTATWKIILLISRRHPFSNIKTAVSGFVTLGSCDYHFQLLVRMSAGEKEGSWGYGNHMVIFVMWNEDLNYLNY